MNKRQEWRQWNSDLMSKTGVDLMDREMRSVVALPYDEWVEAGDGRYWTRHTYFAKATLLGRVNSSLGDNIERTLDPEWGTVRDGSLENVA